MKYLSQDINVFQIILISIFVASIIIFSIAKIKSWDINRPVAIYGVVGIVSTVAMAAWVYSLSMISISAATGINYLTPILTTLIAIIYLREKLHKHVVYALVLGLIGAVVIIQPNYGATSIAGIAGCVLSAFGWAVHDTIIKYQQTKQHNYISQVLYVFLAIALCSIPFAVYYWHPISVKDLILLLVLGVLFSLNMFCLVRAISLTHLVLLAPLSFLRLIFAAVFGYFIFDESLTVNVVAGSSLIIVGSLLIYKAKNAKQYLKSGDQTQELPH